MDTNTKPKPVTEPMSGNDMFEDGKYPDPNYLPDDYRDDPYHSMKNADESILKNEGNDGEHTVVPTDEPEEDTPVLSDVMDEINEFKQTMDPSKLKNAWTMFIDILKGKSDFAEPISVFITKIYYKTMKTPEARKSKNILKSQMSRIMIFPIGLWVLLNWWYLINHTTFTINVLKFANFIPMPVKPIIEAPLYAIDFLNYYLINMREDNDLNPFICNILKTIWGWRPVVFFIALMIFSAIYANVSLSDAITTTAGMSSTANGFMFLLSIYAYCYFNVCEGRIGKLLQWVGGIWGVILAVVVFLLGFILVLVVCSLMTGLYSSFLIFISFFSIFFFAGVVNLTGELGNVFRVVNTAPVSDPNSTDYFVKMKNIFFQNFMDIILAVMVIPLLFQQIIETHTGVSNINMKFTMWMFQIFILFMYVKLVTYPILHPIFDLIQAIFDKKKKEAMAGLSALKNTVKEKSGINALHDSMNDAVSKLQSTQGTDSIAGLGGKVPDAAGLMNKLPSASGMMSGASSLFGKK